MYWKPRECGCYYLGSFEVPGDFYLGYSRYKDVYCYLDFGRPGILFQEGNEGYEYGSYPMSIIKRILYHGMSHTDWNGAAVPIQDAWAYSLYKKKCEGKR